MFHVRQTPQDRRWLAVSTHANMDARVAKDLSRRGIEAFIAVIYRRQKAGSHAWPVAEKWLSPYVLVRIDADAQIKAVRETLGFDEFVTVEPPEPAVFRDNVIDGLRAQMFDSLAESESRARPKESLYRVGQRVVVTSGPAAGKRGKIDRIVGRYIRIDAGERLPITAKEREVMEA